MLLSRLLYLLPKNIRCGIWKFSRSINNSFFLTHLWVHVNSCGFCRIASWSDMASQVDKCHLNQWDDIKQRCWHANTMSHGWRFLLHPQRPSALSLLRTKERQGASSQMYNPVIRTNKFMSYSARQRQLVTAVHEELLKYKGINTEASSRYIEHVRLRQCYQRRDSSASSSTESIGWRIRSQDQSWAWWVSEWVLEYRTLYQKN